MVGDVREFMNKMSRSNRREDVVSPELAPERSWQPRGSSNVYTFRPRGQPVSQKLLERLESENAQLRGIVVELLLQVQALRDDV
jgi:hypothetical protein